jgi:Methyltransferase domain
MNIKHRLEKRALKLIQPFSRIVDILLSPLTLLAVVWFRIARYWGIKNLYLTKKIFLKLGMFPIVDHYYEPLFDYRKVLSSHDKIGSSLSLDAKKQMIFLKQLNYADELGMIPDHSESATEYYYRNGSFGSGDADLYYSIVRQTKPNKILEVGSGFSTRVALKAVQKNKEKNADYCCLITCIEPYEMPWLEELDVKLIRKKVEEIDLTIFNLLDENDILFIDSSHMIRPGGDVLFLILRILPKLKKGVLIHFHDIFTPAEYPIGWLKDEFRMWNEQYLLEALLLNNNSFEVIAALNFLNKNYRREVANIFPALAKEVEREPGSFWIRKTD